MAFNLLYLSQDFITITPILSLMSDLLLFYPLSLYYFSLFKNYFHQKLPETLSIVLKGIKSSCGRDSKLDKITFLKTFKILKSYSSC